MNRILTYAILTTLACSAASASLIHEYNFDSGPQATDSGPGAQNGILLNGALITAGYLSLDGSNDYVQFANHLIPTAAPYTIAFRFQTNGNSQAGIAEMISQGTSG